MKLPIFRVVPFILVSLQIVISQDYVEVEVVNEEIAYCIYYKTSENGIIYISTASKVSVTNLQGQQLILVSDETEHHNKKERKVVIDDDLFLQYQLNQSVQDYYIPTFLHDGFSYPHFNESSLRFLRFLPSYYHFNKLKAAYKRLLSNDVVHSIVKLALIMGQSLNYTGKDYPLLMPLYLIAQTLNKRIDLSKYCISKHTSKFTDEEDDSCFDECPPCPEQECLSLCGYGCSCWKWVCGDCCYHLGCHGHDICCREKFIQTKCLFPVGFKCDSEYKC